MSAPIRTRRAPLPRALALVLACAGVLLVHSPAAAVQCSVVHFPGTDNIFYLDGTYQTFAVSQGSTFWAGLAVMALSPSDDNDTYLSGNCLGGLLAGSAYTAGVTDFVLGDYNESPTGLNTFDITCYSGSCMGSGIHGAATWRTGGLMFVDFPPTTVDFSSGPPYSPDLVMRVWDVYLNAGTTYYFQFSSSLGTGMKMMLFRNPVAGVYYASRANAEFSVSGCTSYTAPTSGYYGLVAVNDSYNIGSYTIGVTSAPTCACQPPALVDRVSVAIPSTQTQHYSWFNHTGAYWTAVGLRPAAGSDWDIETGPSGSTASCLQSVIANSTLGVGAADVVVTDYNFVGYGLQAMRSYRYSGAGGATIQWDDSRSPVDVLYVNGPQVTRSWGGSDIVECWDARLETGTTYTFQFFPSSSSLKLLLFRNPGTGLYGAGRSSTLFEATGTITFTAPATGYYGVVVVKDNDLPGTFALRLGTCAPPETLVAGVPVTDYLKNFHYAVFTPTPGSWSAVGTRCPTADWDIAQYGPSGGAAWPDCYSPSGAVSEAVSVPDFIVGHTFITPPNTYHVRAKQFSSGTSQPVDLEWTGAAQTLDVNGPTITATPDESEVLRLYQAVLDSGVTYHIDFTQPSGSNRHVLIFSRAGAGDYWAPRSTALLETTGSTTFTPSNTGSYAFVLSNDSPLTTSFSFHVFTVPTAVEGGERFQTRLLGAAPNPGRSDLTVRYSLERAAPVEVALIDLAGRRVWVGNEGERPAGEWSVRVKRSSLEGTRLPAGLYFVRLEVGGRVVETRKVSLLD